MRGLKCEGCSREKSIPLVSGSTCCGYCPEWLHECEARHLLGLPLQKRREALDARLKPRGTQAVELLKAKMTEIFNARKKI